MSLRRVVLLAAACVAGLASAALAQRPVRPSPARPGSRDTLARRDTVRAKGDTTTVPDTATKATLVEPDSVMRRLMGLPGYDSKVYQAETITLDALTRGICLAKSAQVASGDSLLMKSESICSSGAGNKIRVGSDSTKGRNIIRLPGQAPIFSSGLGVYDIRGRRATVTEVRTSVDQSGETLQIHGDKIVAVLPPIDSTPAPRDSAARAQRDSAESGRNTTFYVRDGTITACTDSVPDYYFKAGEIKKTGSFVVARPAVLYIGDVPVMWLPFLFQDVRGGRHSGILAPNVGVSDIVRNSPSYRRTIEGLGYYVAISDYVDAQAYLDWRSSAGESDFSDPGYTRYNGELRYNWLDRWVNGRLAVSQTNQGPSKNTAISLDHAQDFTRNSHLRASYNYVTNTFLQRQTTINPLQVSSTIRSSASYDQKLGTFSFQLGGSQTQYPGRTQVERGLPTFNMTTSPVDIGDWLVWTPSLNYTSTQTLHIDQPSNLSLFLRSGVTAAGADTIFGDTLRRNDYRSSLSFGSPLQILGYQIGNQLTINSRLSDFPQLENVTNVTTGEVTPRIYASTFETSLDWTPSFTLPALARNNFNLSPSLSFANVAPGAFAVRNHRTNGEWVRQTKRPTFGLSASPTVFGFFDGFGPFARLRHSITPVVTYTYAPARHVSEEYIAAIAGINSLSTGQYLPGLAQNALSFQLSTNVEAKRRSPNDSTPEAGDKVKLISLNFSPLNYDFERARATHSRIRGLTTEQFNWTAGSELLPGLALAGNYSLFEGSTATDSAKFSPFFEGITANFSFSPTANPFAVFARLFGKAVPVTQPNPNTANPPPDERYERQVASQPVAGRSASRAAFQPTNTGGWKASFAFTAQRHRPVTGTNVIPYDASVRCAQFNAARFKALYDQCIAQALSSPVTENSINSGLAGSTIISYPNTTALNSDLEFNLTEHWSAIYTTAYDFERHNFSSQVASLQRDLHDWRANFNFSQGPNGAFAFSFVVSLKAEPELKFDYRKATFRGASAF